MLTIRTSRAETRSISIAAHPQTVFELLSDPRRLPDWAPAFAQSVSPVGKDWLVDTGFGDLRITVRAGREHGTVDLLKPGNPGVSAYMRVVPNNEGSEFLFTLLFAHGTDEAAVALQMTTIEAELETVRALCETPLARVAA